jgi:hypothetical protein
MQHMLMSIASPDHDPKISALNEQNLVRLYGFNSQEAASFHSAGQAYAAVIQNYQAQIEASNQATILSASVQVDSAVTALANQLLTAVRPQKAEMIQVYASKVAAATSNGGN